MSIIQACEKKVVTVFKDTSIQEAAKLMKEKNIGDVVVVESRENCSQPIGILTDRDLVVKFASDNIDINSITVGDALSRRLFTLNEKQGINEAIVAMSEHGVRRAPVVNENKELVGIVSIDDLLVLIAEELSYLANLVRKQGAGGVVSAS